MPEIKTASELKANRIFSPFPSRTRPFTEPISATADAVLGQGLSLPDLIRKYYPSAKPSAIKAGFGFLNRDNKDKDYIPEKEDPFVFNRSSPLMFKNEALRLLEVLANRAVELGLPVKFDEELRINKVDSERVTQLIEDDDPNMMKTLANPAANDAVMFIIGNTDIMRKASIVRAISPGWWASSYRGKSADNKAYFMKALSAYSMYVKELKLNPTFQSAYKTNWDDNADPILTNPGYPFFTTEVSATGTPISRIKTVELFKRLASTPPEPGLSKWQSILNEVDNRAGKYGLRGYPFCVAPLRRLSAGYKWSHQFTITAAGMKTAFDYRGLNSQRVAWMVPYAYNILISPCATLFKTIRQFMPGAIHTGPTKTAIYSEIAQMTKDGRCFMAEADYSNYDRFIPVDLVRQILALSLDGLDDEQYWMDAIMHLHDDASLIWPDYNALDPGHGWAFKPGILGLLSGVKITSETGTLVNCIVNLAALGEAESMSVEAMLAYLRLGLQQDRTAHGIKYLVQSDDTLLIADSPRAISKRMKAFMTALRAAGLKGGVEYADRFLMRQMQNGSDRPVPARIWQNTLSNETPPADEIVFLMGLVARTDGLLGIKVVDPFKTGVHQHVTLTEIRFSLQMLISLRKFLESATVKSAYAKTYIDLLISAATAATGSSALEERYVTVPPLYVAKIKALAKEITVLAAKLRLASQTSQKSYDAWLESLLRDRFVPSSEAMLAYVSDLDSYVDEFAKGLQGKENAFFKYAASSIGVSKLTVK